MTNGLDNLFLRDLERLKTELKAYKNEPSLWLVPEGILNSGGNLALHLVGNLNHFIGTILGQTGYVRDRVGEFNNKDIPKDDIIKSIDDLKISLSTIFDQLNQEELDKNYPSDVIGRPNSTGTFLMHLYGHLNYHLGQINYHRRLISHFN